MRVFLLLLVLSIAAPSWAHNPLHHRVRPSSLPPTEASGPQFVAVKPGGATICAHGGEYAFFFRPGSVNKLAVFFQGGGACWDSGSCLLPIYTSTVDVDGTLGMLNGGDDGINSNDPRSPIHGWNVLYIPYCTGDVHAGNNTASYGVHHRGRVNVEAALHYVFDKVPSPEAVASIGCSAGSLGVFLNAPYVLQHYNSVPNYVWGDSEVGILTEAQYNGAWENWHLQLASFIPALAPSHTRTWNPTVCGYIVQESAKYFDKAQWAAYTSDFDMVQSTYYKLGGGKADWTTLMREQFQQIHGNVTNVASFIAPGGHHCVSVGDDFWGVKSDGVSLVTWVNDIFNGKAFNHTVDCTPNCL